MYLSRLKEVIIGHTTFGRELDFPKHLFRNGLAAIGGLFGLRLTLVGPQIPETDIAIGVFGILFIVSLVLMFYFLQNTVQYTVEKEIRRLRRILTIGTTYLLLSAIVVICLYPLLNILRPEPFNYTSTEIAAGLNIASYAALLTIIGNRNTLKSQYPSLQTIQNRFTEETNQALNRIQTTIDGIGHVERPETDRATDRLSNGENIIVTGEGGVGKSGVLAGVADEWEKDVLFIDSSTHSAVRNQAELSTALGFDNGIQRPIEQIAVANHVLLIVDQLDDIDREAGNVYRDLILAAGDLDNVTIAFACRNHDLTVRREYEPLDNAESFTTRLTIGLLRTTDAEDYVQELIGESPSNDLIQIGRKIENLDIIAQLAKDVHTLCWLSGLGGVRSERDD